MYEFLLPPNTEIWQYIQNIGLRIPLWMTGDCTPKRLSKQTSEIIAIPPLYYRYPTLPSQLVNTEYG